MKPTDPFEYREISRDPFKPEAKQVYVRIRPGDRIEENQPLAMIENTLAILGYNSAVEAEKVAIEETKSLTQQTKYWFEDLAIVTKGFKSGSSSQSEVNRSTAQWLASQAQELSKREAELKAGYDKEISLKKLQKHIILSILPGRVQSIGKQVGEAVKPGDNLGSIAATFHRALMPPT